MKALTGDRRGPGTARNWLALAVAGATAVGLTGLAGAAEAAASLHGVASKAPASGWRVVATAGGASSPGLMEALASVSADDAWAFGTLWPKSEPDTYIAIARHWNGKSWQKVGLPAPVTAALSGFPSTVAAASGPRNVWAFTGEGAWVRYNGRSWSTGELPLEQPDDVGIITSAVVLSSDDVWALGYYNPVSPLPYIAHYNGRHWKLTNLYLNTAIEAASAVSPSDIWAVGADNTNYVLRWNGKVWTHEPLPKMAYMFGVVALSRTDVWVTGDAAVPSAHYPYTPGVARWNGHSWRTYTLAASPDPLINAAPDGHGGIWAVAQEPGAVPAFTPDLWHYTGGHWGHSHIPGADAFDIVDQFAAIPGTTSIWAAGVFKSGRLNLAAILLDGPAPH
jgi:hypothetical protein